MLRRRITAAAAAAVLILNSAPVIAKSDEDFKAPECLFADSFESYGDKSAELSCKLWDVIIQDDDEGGSVTTDKNDGNGFAALTAASLFLDGRITTPTVSIKKNGFGFDGEKFVFDTKCYTFDDTAKFSVIFTDAQNRSNVEIMSLRGGVLSVRNDKNITAPVKTDVPVHSWNRISIVTDTAVPSVDVYVNGELICESRKITPVDFSDMSVKAAVKNGTMEAYSVGRIYLDDVYIYKSDKPAKDTSAFKTEEKITTYLNKQFTSVAENGKSHGISGFTTGVAISDTPSAQDKSAEITLGAEAAFIPLESEASGTVTIKAVYKTTDDIYLTARDKNGKTSRLSKLPKMSEFGECEVSVDTAAKKAYADGKETDIDIESLLALGFEGSGGKITLNKLFAVSGSEMPDNSYFPDYSYTKRAAATVVTTSMRSAYETLSRGVFMSIDFYQSTVFGARVRFDGAPPRMIDGEPYVPLKDSIIMLGGEYMGEEEFKNAEGKTVSIAKGLVYNYKNIDYIKASDLADLFRLKLSWDGEYLLAFGRETLFSGNADIGELKSALYYSRPTGAEIFDLIQKNGGAHPRVLADADRINEVRYNIKHNPKLKEWSDKLIAEADGYLDAYALYYTKSDGVRILSVSNLMLARMQALGWAYKLTGDTKYPEAAWRDLSAVCSFSDWNPSHFLDVATMSLGVATGYSWFYDYLSEDRKTAIVNGFVKNGLSAYINALDKRDWWTFVNSNWNPWCHGDVMQAIIAMSDRLGEDGMYALDRAFPYMEYLYPEFVPDGAWAEGLSYHAETLKQLSMWCNTLDLATGKDFGYWDLPGMDVTAYYGEALSGAGGVYNYGDNTEVVSNCPAQAWFAYKYNDPALAALRYNAITANSYAVTLFDLVMTRPEMLHGESSMDNDLFYKNMNVFSMRTNWSDSSDGIFLAGKGGENGTSHFHYDLGGFVMDIGGVRFAYELGREGYAITQNDTKTYQYKKRAEGHNTYVINPSALPGQADTAKAPVTRFESKPRGGIAVIDLANAYGARKFYRGFKMTDDRQTAIIQDEVELAAKSEVYWFMHTAGDIRLSDDKKSVYITKDGVTAKFEILDSDNGGAEFAVMDALPLETTPWLDGQGRNEKYKKIAVHWDGVQRFTLAIAARQILDDSLDAPYAGEVTPISEWEIPDGEVSQRPKLETISQNGALIEDFSPDKYSYVVELPYDCETKPEYGFIASDDLSVTRYDTEGITGITRFIVTDKASGLASAYQITTKLAGYVGVLPNTKEAKVVKVTASAEPEYDQGNRAVCVLDGDYISRWTATDDAWIMLELDEITDVYALGIAWYLGDERTYIYELEISEDGENWIQVSSGTSSGTTKELECFLLGNRKAKYVRYQGHGHSAGNWNNITEMRVYTKSN